MEVYVFDMSRWMPHGHCVQWNWILLTLQILHNTVIAMAYAAIPVLIIAHARRRRWVIAPWAGVIFALFIVLCGATHVMQVVTVWVPAYWLDVAVSGGCAVASMGTAYILWKSYRGETDLEGK